MLAGGVVREREEGEEDGKAKEGGLHRGLLQLEGSDPGQHGMHVAHSAIGERHRVVHQLAVRAEDRVRSELLHVVVRLHAGTRAARGSRVS